MLRSKIDKVYVSGWVRSHQLMTENKTLFLWNGCLCHPKIHMLLSNPMVLVGEAFHRWLGQEGGALVYEISALIMDRPERSLSPSTMWGHSKNTAICELRRQRSLTLTLLLPWCETSQPPELWEMHFHCLSHTVYGTFVIAAQMDIYHINYVLPIQNNMLGYF